MWWASGGGPRPRPKVRSQPQAESRCRADTVRPNADDERLRDDDDRGMRSRLKVVRFLAAIAVAAVALGAASSASAVAVTQFQTEDRHPHSIILGDDGAVWFADGTKIGRATPDGRIEETVVVAHRATVKNGMRDTDFVNDIAVGGDGRIWFVTNDDVNRIGAMTTDGQITRYRLDTVPVGELEGVDVRPRWLGRGPDGAIWFAHYDNAAIGRITSDGAVSEFTNGVRGYIGRPVAGPDGAMWFTDSGLARITSAGVVAHLPSSPLQTFPSHLAVSPSGELWFTASNDRRVYVGRATNAGAQTLFASGTQGAYALTVDRVGGAWFSTDRDCLNAVLDMALACKLAHIDAAGAVTPYAGGVLSQAQIVEMTVGPDGMLWFADLPGGRIGRLDLDACGGQMLPPWNIRRRWPSLVTATAWLDGRRITLHRHPSTIPIDLRLHPKGTATVRVVGRLGNRRKVVAQRNYDVCPDS